MSFKVSDLFIKVDLINQKLQLKYNKKYQKKSLNLRNTQLMVFKILDHL